MERASHRQLPLRIWRAIGVAALWFGSVLAAGPAFAADRGTIVGLPDGFVLDAPLLERTLTTHPNCPECAVVTLHNSSTARAQASVRVNPLTLPPPVDRSFGAWIYSYVREHTGIDGDIELAEPDAAQNTNALGSRSRFQLRALSFTGPAVSYSTGDHQITLPMEPGTSRELTLYNGPTLASSVAGSPIEDFLYWSLWSPFRWLCLQVEALIAALLPMLGAFGVILLIVLIVRAITFPINRWSFQSQQAFEAVQRDIAPELADIKARLKGGDQSEAILKLYQDRNMNPLSGLKGSVGLFVQIPILVAMFNVASDSAILNTVSMAWIENIALPEHTATWGLDIPLLGSFFNLIAFGLASFMLWGELSKPTSERSLGTLVFAIAVGVLLYSFPVFLVIYWFLITIAQKVEQTLATKTAAVE